MWASLILRDGPLNSGHYRLTVNSIVADRAGNALDGDGDGTGGDPYYHVFDVVLPSGLAFEGRSNDDALLATSLPLTEDPLGGGYFGARGFGSIDPSTDEDWWSFAAMAGDRVAVSVDTPDSNLYPRVLLYNSSVLSNPSVNQVTYDDNGGPGNDAKRAR